MLKTIELIKESFGGSTIVYTKGSCVKLCMILKHIYPQGEILYDLNHAIFEYNGNTYDINGFAEKTIHHTPIQQYGLLQSYRMMHGKYSINDINSSQNEATKNNSRD